MIIVLVLAVVMVFLLIAAAVFAGLVNKHHSGAVCSIYRVPHDFINGVKLSDKKDFIGLSNFSKVIEIFSKNLPKVVSLENAFIAISTKSFAASASNALQSLKLFSETFRGATTWDGRSRDLSPISILSLTDHVNQDIHDEFMLFDKTAKALSKFTEVGNRILKTNLLSQTGESIILNSLEFKKQIDDAIE